MKNYSFTPDGVVEWISDYQALSIVGRAQEKDFILADFRLWVQERFSLKQSQVDYVSTFSFAFIAELAQQIVYSLDRGEPITLSLPSSRDGGSEDSVKVTELKKRAEESSPDDPDPNDARSPRREDNYISGLDIRIYYREK